MNDLRVISRPSTDGGASYNEAVARLRGALVASDHHAESQETIAAKDEVVARFGPSFRPGRVADITAEEFQAFLRFKNNRHWTGLERLGPRICADMDALRSALGLLVDEAEPLAERATRAVDMVTGMASAVSTAVLLVAYPDRYGVWNSTSEGGLKAVGLWPTFDRGASFGERYVAVNSVLVALAADVGTDLWTLDSLWWVIAQPEVSAGSADEGTEATSPTPDEDGEGLTGGRFGLERHLHEFLRDNWDEAPFGGEWALYSEPGVPEAGYEYPCGVGRIDLLARHRVTGDWLVVELKRGQTSDQTVGQVLRYVGWVRRHLAGDGETVRGVIVARGADDNLRYALDGAPGVDLKLYEVEFRLRDAPEL